MQGLAHYAASPSPPPVPTSPSSIRRAARRSSQSHALSHTRAGDDQPVAGPSSGSSASRVPNPQPHQAREKSRLKRSSPSHSNTSPSISRARANEAGPSTAHTPSANSKRRKTQSSSTETSAAGTPLPENLTHTRQSDLPNSDLAETRVSQDEKSAEEGGIPGFSGMSEDNVFRLITRPPEIPGLVDWGIPPMVDSALVPEALKAKVSNFLRLKYEREQHINTTLLSSSAFANPHIYSKLVEFVDLDETSTAFPGSGWITRRNLEAEIPLYGPKALNAQQKAKEEALRKSQEIGKRSTIDFARGKHSESSHSASGRGDRDRERYRSAGHRDRDRDRERQRDRERERNGGRRDRDRR